ncbi:MAG: alpha/beta fold hydrolase [Isosphaeraceae bacterium]|nr:alpha/beta fold hydrolase [Isosphaeraceae bacterium]
MNGEAYPRSPWLRYFPSPRPGSAVTIVCCPHAGGSASVFRDWSMSLPHWLDVWGVQPPGRESRLAEPPYREMTRLVADLVTAVVPILPDHFALFGHSLGALIAFEAAREMERRGGPAPRTVIVSGCPAPPSRRRLEYNPKATDDELLQRIRDLGGSPESALGHPELRQLILTALRTDLELAESYEFVPGSPLNCPLVAVAGDADPVVPADGLVDWRFQTTGAFTSRRFRGGHFFFLSKESHAGLTVLLAEVLRPIRSL